LLLILDSLGTSEFLLILVVAMIFFGPRKLPQLSRQIGKSLAEFKKASEDFKRTWEREVALETHSEPDPNRSTQRDSSVIETTVGRTEAVHNALSEETPTGPIAIAQEPAAMPTDVVSAVSAAEPASIEPAPKRDWL
jgi:Tat protein translocase TatB subunit